MKAKAIGNETGGDPAAVITECLFIILIRQGKLLLMGRNCSSLKLITFRRILKMHFSISLKHAIKTQVNKKKK
jgi:hypothetical protein